MVEDSVKRYPATAYDKDASDWDNFHGREISQQNIARELAHSVSFGLPVHGGRLTTQLPDGTEGPEDGSAVSTVWASTVKEDGSRVLLGWYESSR